MKWTVLGCHSPYPPKDGATLGYLLEANGRNLLIDCGSGVLAKLSAYIDLDKLDGVILSHLHHDHISDFFVLQYAVRLQIQRKKRKKKLAVWAPDRPQHWAKRLSYHDLIDVKPLIEGRAFEPISGVVVKGFLTDHAIPCYALVIKDGSHTILYGADAGPKTRWKQMVNAPDLFICEATFLHQDLPLQKIGHLSAKQAAIAAKEINAKRLLLTHLFPGYDPQEIKREAEAIFPQVDIAYSGWSMEF